jgi:hypothetical protein
MLSAQVNYQLREIGRYETGLFDESAAEISAYDASTQRLYVINSGAGTVDVLDLSDPTLPAVLFSISVIGSPNSVAAYQGLIAVAVADTIGTNPGSVEFLDADGNGISSVGVGANPDMVTFTPDGSKVLVANEGEPSDDYLIDPEGSISIIDVSLGAASATVSTADFSAIDSASLDSSVRIFGPGASIAQDLEPEFITVAGDGRYAWVSCQENNAIAVVDINAGSIVDVFGLGYKDHSLPGNGLDPSNRDDTAVIANWPVLGMYQPDAIAWYRAQDGNAYIITANEGDARDYDGYSEEARMDDLLLDTIVFPNAAELQMDENLGRLKTTVETGDSDGDGFNEELYAYGARSFSIYTATGTQVYDSGDDLEQITLAANPDNFNSTDDENDSFDDRSDDKGPEPEGVVVGRVGARSFAFIGLERVGGVMVYEVTDALAPQFVQYINTRDFSGDAEAGTAGDLAPEGLVFIDAENSPNGQALLVVSYEISGSVVVFEFSPNCATPTNLNSTVLGSSGVQLDWDAVADAEGYRIFLEKVSTGERVIGAAAVNTKSVGGLEAGETYQWTLRTSCGVDRSPFAEVATFSLPAAREADLISSTMIAPNPAVDVLQVTANGSEMIEMFDLAGRGVHRSFQGGSQIIDVNDMPRGQYVLRITYSDRVESLPVSLQ